MKSRLHDKEIGTQGSWEDVKSGTGVHDECEEMVLEEKLGQDEGKEKVAREVPRSLKSWSRNSCTGGQGLGELC